MEGVRGSWREPEDMTVLVAVVVADCHQVKRPLEAEAQGPEHHQRLRGRQGARLQGLAERREDVQARQEE